MLACAVPEQVHFVAKAEFARNVFLRRLFTALGVLFVKREEADISALRRAMTFLNYNKSLGIFPEGKRHYDGIMGEFKPGFAFIAYKSDAKVVPVAIIESRYFFNFLRRSKKVIIGKPQSIVKGDMENSAFLVHHSNKVREAIAIMLNEYS
jgi:1-acyl-sn-glycerol-3-phosphate acyltransferase